MRREDKSAPAESSERLLVLTDPGHAAPGLFAPASGVASAPFATELMTPRPAEFAGDDAVRRELWKRLAPTALVLSNYADDVAFGYRQLARESGVPCLAHIDEDPYEQLPAADQPGRVPVHEAKARLRRLMEDADIVYVPTPELAARLRRQGVRASVVHGPAPGVSRGGPPVPGPATVPVLGFASLRRDPRELASVTPAVARLMQALPWLRFECLCDTPLPDALLPFGTRVRVHPPVDGPEALRARLRELGWWVGLAPVPEGAADRPHDEEPWITYAQAGTAVVAADVPAFARAAAAGACALASQTAQWVAAIARLLVSAEERSQQMRRADGLLDSHRTSERLMHDIVSAVRLARRGETPRSPAPEQGGAPVARVLFVANALIPTLQLSFLKPLAPDVDAGRLVWKLVSGDELKARRASMKGQRGVAAAIREWLLQEVEEFQPNHVVFCRYSDQMSEEIVAWARERHVPVMFHVDDDLLNVPIEIGEAKWRMHNAPERLAAVRYLLENVDMTYCSTLPLLQRYRSLGFEGPMQAGHVYCASSVLNRAELRPVRKLGYMGFDHAHDFEIAIPAIVKLMRKRPEISFELFGSIPRPAEFDEFGDRVALIPPVRVYAEFMQRFASLGWDIGLCPLAYTDFNLVKANTKWVEYTSIGAAVVASADTVYDTCAGDGCGALVRTSADWFDTLDALCDSPELRFSMVSRAQQRLEAEYSDERLRQQVWDMLERCAAVTADKA